MSETAVSNQTGVRRAKKTIKIVGPKARKANAAATSSNNSAVQVDENMFATNSIGGYQIVRLLGKGVSGTVYEAMGKDGTYCAIKQVKLSGVSKADRAEMEQEIDLLKKLDHLNVVKHLETIVNDSLNIVLEYVDGGTLTDQLANFSKKPESLVAYYTLQILSGLAYIHSKGVIHRDLKGVNILSTKDGVVKLVDFGVAKMWTATKTHSVIGTPYWMAPEVIQMNAKESSACDIWSLGCTVVELLIGQPPFFGLHPMAALYQMVQVVAPPIDPACCSSVCLDFLSLCFQQDPKNRPSAQELLTHPWVVDSEKGGEDLVRASVIMMQNKWREQRQKTQAFIVRHASLKPAAIKLPPSELTVDVDDMVDMQNMTADLVTENLENRFNRGCIYTNISSILICINPYRVIDNLYSNDKLRQFHHKVARRDMEHSPHIFAIARSAFANAVSIDTAPGVNRNQAILISGESGAGKTEATKHILRYITAMSGSRSVNEISEPNAFDPSASFTIEDKLMQANPILEAFGNAKTLRNDNSSRFGKWISIQLSAANFGTIGGACILKYLLEESRVVCPTLGERNFNVFYQVCGDVVSRYQDPSFSAQNFRYLVPADSKDAKEAVAINGVDDNIEFQRIVKAMHCLGFTEQERDFTFGVIQAILRLGNLSFTVKDKAKGHAQLSPEATKHIPHIALALGVSETSLAEALCVKVQVIANQRIDRPRTVHEAMMLVDAISKSLYGRLFTWIIWRINVALARRVSPPSPTLPNTSLSAAAVAASTTEVQKAGGVSRRLSVVKEAQLAALALNGPKDMQEGRERRETNGQATTTSKAPLSQLQQADVAYTNKITAATAASKDNSSSTTTSENNTISKLSTLARLQLADTSIGILDIFGFEVFQKNSLEQLCINLANETLQQYFIHYIFKLEQALYLQEKLNVDQMTFADNKQCVELLGGKYPGVFAMLHDELAIPGGSDSSFLDKIKREHQKHPFFGDGTTKVAAAHTFTIRHYAEAVCYHVEGFLEKNRSQTGEDVIALLQTSQQSVLALVYSPVYELLGERDPQKGLDAIAKAADEPTLKRVASSASLQPGKRPNKPTAQSSLGSKFQESLKDLISSLEAATPHFVRCVKPNQLKKSHGVGGFDRTLVLNQLRTSGMLDSVQIRKMGYPERLPHAVFLNRYIHLYQGATTQQEILKRMNEEVCKKFPEEKSGPPLFQIGLTKVFLKPKAWAYLEIQRSVLLSRSILVIQKYARAKQARVEFKRMKAAISALNTAVATGNLKAIDSALLVASRDGVNKRIVQSFWLKRTSIEQTLLTRKELSEVLLEKGPSISIRLAALTISISRAQKAQQSFTEPFSSALLSLCMDLHGLFVNVLGDISRLRGLIEIEEKSAKEAQFLLEDFPKRVTALLSKHVEGVPQGAIGGLSDSDLAFIRKELLWSANEAAECVELKLALKNLQVIEKQLMESMIVSKYESLSLAVEALPSVRSLIDKATSMRYRRLPLLLAQAHCTAVATQSVVFLALEKGTHRTDLLSALHIVSAELNHPHLMQVDSAMRRVQERFKVLLEGGASSVQEAVDLLEHAIALMDQTEKLHHFLSVRSLDMQESLECLELSREMTEGNKQHAVALKFAETMHKVEKRVRLDAASNLQLVIASPSPDLSLLSVAISLGKRAGLSAQELASAAYFLELQQDLPRLIAERQPEALQSLLVRVKEASSRVYPHERAAAMLFQNLTVSTEKALNVLTLLEKLKLVCVEISKENPSSSNIQVGQNLVAELTAAGTDAKEILPYQTIIQNCMKEQEARKLLMDKQQAQELEQKRQAEEIDRKKREAEEVERQKKRAEELEKKRQEDESERRRLVESIESKRRAEESERQLQEETDRKEAEETERVRKREEEERMRKEAEAERVRKREEEMERARKREELLERARKHAEEVKENEEKAKKAREQEESSRRLFLLIEELDEGENKSSPAVKPLPVASVNNGSLRAPLSPLPSRNSSSSVARKDSDISRASNNNNVNSNNIAPFPSPASSNMSCFASPSSASTTYNSFSMSPRESFTTARSNERERASSLLNMRQQERSNSVVSSSPPPGAAPTEGLPSYGEALSAYPTVGLPSYEESFGDARRVSNESRSEVFDNARDRESSLASFSQRSQGSLPPLPTGRVIHEGYLAKKSGGGIPLLRHWQKRYFVLYAPNQLVYYTDSTKKELKGTVPLECVENLFAKMLRITLVMEPIENKGKTKQRKFHLTAPTAADTSRWIKAFETSFKEIDELEEENEAKE